jgi:hypothetical protein
MKPAKIQKISRQQLEALLTPHMLMGLVRTTYNAGTTAFEYRLPNCKLLAVSVADNHFCEIGRVPMVNVVAGVV